MRRGTDAIRLTGMRGDERVQDGMFSYVSLEQRVPQDHPLRAVRKLAVMYRLAEQDLYQVMLKGTLERAEAALKRKFFGPRKGN